MLFNLSQIHEKKILLVLLQDAARTRMWRNGRRLSECEHGFTFLTIVTDDQSEVICMICKQLIWLDYDISMVKACSGNVWVIELLSVETFNFPLCLETKIEMR